MIRRVLVAPVQARTWRELGYAVTGTLLGLPMFLLAALGLVFTVLSLLTVGLPFLVGVLWLVRHSVRYFRRVARRLLGWTWPSPPPVRHGGGPVRWGSAVLKDSTAWRALAYCLVQLPLLATTAYFGLLLVIVSVVAVTFPTWWFRYPEGHSFPGALLLSAEGLVGVLLFPWYLRLLVGLNHLLVRALLEPSPDRARVAALESSREALRADAAALQRRVERNLHDGTQGRLVALGVTLSRMARRTADPQLQEMISEARGAVVDALAELRDIVRGLHPPALDDGLPTALETLAARSPVPVEMRVQVHRRPSPATESALYFTAAELLANVARHARASHVRLCLREDGDTLLLQVTDDGRGGAQADDGGTGLAGLARRAVALDGALTINSPPGGPTTIRVTLPREG